MRPIIYVSLLVILFPIATQAQIVDSVDTPYTVDKNTRLLLHFNDSLETGLDARIQGKAQFFNTDWWISSMKQSIHFENEYKDDSSSVTVQDTSMLDLQGSWTIEAWLSHDGPIGDADNYFVNCDYQTGHAVLWSKAGADSSNINVQTYVNICTRKVITEYAVKGRSSPYRFAADEPIIGAGPWHHIAVVRNVAQKALTLYIHRFIDYKDTTTLVYKKTWNINGDTLMTNDSPLQIGRGPMPTHPKTEVQGVNGSIDEFRISDTVRKFARATDIPDPPGDHVPEKTQLQKNYPNPFNSTTRIRFKLSRARPVTLTVYNSLGQHLETLINRRLNAGSHATTFNAEGLPSGVYMYQLEAGSYRETRKMLLVK